MSLETNIQVSFMPTVPKRRGGNTHSIPYDTSAENTRCRQYEPGVKDGALTAVGRKSRKSKRNDGGRKY